jgi:hypothetical protein
MNKPIGKAKRDIVAGETIEVTFNPLGGFESEAIEFYNMSAEEKNDLLFDIVNNFFKAPGQTLKG